MGAKTDGDFQLAVVDQGLESSDVEIHAYCLEEDVYLKRFDTDDHL